MKITQILRVCQFTCLLLIASSGFAQSDEVPAIISETSSSSVTTLMAQQGALPGVPAFTMTPRADGGEDYTVTIQILAMMTALTLLPAFLLMMTSFARIIIVFAILRQALGLQQTPSNQILLGLALFLTIFIMRPVFESVNVNALQPYMQEQITSVQAVDRAIVPIHGFMRAQTRESDIDMFVRISDSDPVADISDLPFFVLAPAFLTSELKTAFQIGFLLFLPFLVIDMVIASTLMSLGMMMLSPMLVSLPFKLLLFVLVDGWAMTVGSQVATYSSN